jgi:hypothetical protein
LLHRMRHGERWGIESVEPNFDFAKVFATMRQARAE